MKKFILAAVAALVICFTCVAFTGGCVPVDIDEALPHYDVK